MRQVLSLSLPDPAFEVLKSPHARSRRAEVQIQVPGSVGPRPSTTYQLRFVLPFEQIMPAYLFKLMLT